MRHVGKARKIDAGRVWGLLSKTTRAFIVVGGKEARKDDMGKAEQWITVQEAARILSENSGHEVKPDYVRYLGWQGKVASKPLDGRTKLYLKRDIEHYLVHTKRGPRPGSKRRPTSKPPVEEV